ncbi:hypothetical protein EXS71_00290 [Candidatus Uhrbacteria bacterium]|nr:hypothetical protein [Candidatus Uhrbacteria bacterium]
MTKKHKPPHSRIFLLFGFVVVLVGGLLLIWNEIGDLRLKSMPTLSPIAPLKDEPPSEIKKSKQACQSAYGYWIDCGSPCHGKGRDVVCAQVCESQCLCGGLAGWQCPAATVCTDWDPSQAAPDAVGVCRPRTEIISVPTPVLLPVPQGMICDETHSICVDQSYENKLMTNPVVVTGTARAFEQQFSWAMEDGNGKVIKQGNIMTHGPDMATANPFTLRTFLTSVPKTTTGTLVLLEFSPRDGSPIHVLRIPIRFPSDTTTVKLMVPEDWAAWVKAVQADIDAGDVKPHDQTPAILFHLESIVIPKTIVPAEATLETVLDWLRKKTGKDQELDVKSFKVKQGIAYVVLAWDQDRSADLFALTAVYPVIQKTLVQFSSIVKVLHQENL